MSERIPIPRAAAERLRSLSLRRELADAEARGLIAGLALLLVVAEDQVAGFDDGDEPALLLNPPASDPPSSQPPRDPPGST